VRLALEYYLTSFRGPLDEAYLKLVVVLEGLAMEVLNSIGEERGVITLRNGKAWSVKDPTAWKSFVAKLKQSNEFKAWTALLAANADEVREHALSVDGLVNWTAGLQGALRLKPDLGELSAGKRVQAAFAAVGLTMDPAMKAESKRWHQARHVAIARSASDKTLEQQVAVIRTMVVALLFRWMDYDGPLIGYHRDGRGVLRQSDVEWWGDPSKATAMAEAAVRYLSDYHVKSI